MIEELGKETILFCCFKALTESRISYKNHKIQHFKIIKNTAIVIQLSDVLKTHKNVIIFNKIETFLTWLGFLSRILIIQAY